MQQTDTDPCDAPKQIVTFGSFGYRLSDAFPTSGRRGASVSFIFDTPMASLSDVSDVFPTAPDDMSV